MKTKEFMLIGPRGKLVSIIAPVDIEFPTVFINDYQPCCGAGNGIGNAVVPETVWGLRISAACFVHDDMWFRGEKSWQTFHQSNSIFLKNIISIIETCSRNQALKWLRLYRAVTYYNAVDLAGKRLWVKKQN